MFRRSWQGLPGDVTFPKDLRGLGYFVNESDQIRSLESPDTPYVYVVDKNERINHRRRHHFEQEIEKIIHGRVQELGVERVRLPLAAKSDEPSVPILISSSLQEHSHIVLVVGEPTNRLGVLAERVIGGEGGINNGSMISAIQALQKLPTPPGIVIANMGELYWCPERNRSFTVKNSTALPLPSLAHKGRKYRSSMNDIPYNETPENHLRCVFQEVLRPLFQSSGKKLSILAIGSSSEIVEKFLDNDRNWSNWGKHLNSMVLFGPQCPVESLTNPCLKAFLKKRTRGYVCSSHDLDIAVADADGNEHESMQALGMPCYSSAEPHYVELIAINSFLPALSYLQTTVQDTGFANPRVVVPKVSEQVFDDPDGDPWLDIDEADRPQVSKLDPATLQKQIKQLKRWRKFHETGEAPETDSESDEDDE